MKRIEVWFNSGLFRAFPHVDEKTVEKYDGYLSFTFSGGNGATINLNHVNFMEEMDED